MKKLLVLASALSVLAIVAGSKPANATALNLFTSGSGWQVASSTGLTAATAVANVGAWTAAPATDLTVFPKGYWNNVADSSDSVWISNQPKYYPLTNTDKKDTFYVFQTTFDIGTGHDPINLAFTSLSGSWLTDNSGGGVYLNGVEASTYFNAKPGNGDFSKAMGTYNFDLTGSLQNGVNTLDFVVFNSETNKDNTGNPVGLRAYVNGDIPAVPEPAFVQLGVLLSSGGLLVLRRRKA